MLYFNCINPEIYQSINLHVNQQWYLQKMIVNNFDNWVNLVNIYVKKNLKWQCENNVTMKRFACSEEQRV